MYYIIYTLGITIVSSIW